MFNELDRVELMIDLPENGFKKGDQGTVVYVYKLGAACEVEFMSDGRTIAVVTLMNVQIQSI